MGLGLFATAIYPPSIAVLPSPTLCAIILGLHPRI